MPLAVRHRDDPAPGLAPAPELTVRRASDAAAMAALQARTEAEIAARLAGGHRAYAADWQGSPVAWGWVATRSAEIGELGFAFTMPPAERYLWNFVTAKPYRGLGIYPRLLDAVVQLESAEAERFWIACAPENHASASGIRKAAFTFVADLSFDAVGRPAVTEVLAGSGGQAARLLGLAQAREHLAPCWRCWRAAIASSCSTGRCACDYQRPRSGCAA